MEIIEKLRKERQDLVERLKQIDKMLRQYDELNQVALTLLTSTDSQSKQNVHVAPIPRSDLPGFNSGLTSHDLSSRKKTPTEEFERIVLEVLREASSPMDRAEMYEALTKRGVVIGDGDKDKEMNALSARLYRMGQQGLLESRRGQGYRIKDLQQHPRERGVLDALNQEDDDDLLG